MLSKRLKPLDSISCPRPVLKVSLSRTGHPHEIRIGRQTLTMMMWYPNSVLASPKTGLVVVLVARPNATSSNLGSRLPFVFQPREPPARLSARHALSLSSAVHLQVKMTLTLPRLVFGELSRNLVKLGSVSQLNQGFLLLSMLLALDVFCQIAMSRKTLAMRRLSPEYGGR